MIICVATVVFHHDMGHDWLPTIAFGETWAIAQAKAMAAMDERLKDEDEEDYVVEYHDCTAMAVR